MLTSRDGHTWTKTPTDLPGYIYEAVATPDGYLGVGMRGRVGRSTDGQSWSMSTVVPSSEELYDVARFQDKYLVVGESGAIAVSTDGGHEWTATTTWEIDLEGSDYIVDITSANGVLVCVSSGGRVFRSLDGFEWQQVADFRNTMYSVQAFNDAFWAVGGLSLIAHSDDGISWSIRHSGDWPDYADIATNGEVTVVVGSRVLDGLSALVATSVDGLTWNQVDLDDAEGLRIASVTWAGAQFVGVGNRGTVFRSEDGFEWSFDSLDLDSRPPLRRVVSNGSVLVATGGDANGDVLLVSDDGITWQPTFLERPVLDVTWTGELFVVVGGGVHSSHDGHRWTTSPSGFARGGQCVTGNGEEIIVSGSAGFVMRARRVAHQLYVDPPEIE